MGLCSVFAACVQRTLTLMRAVPGSEASRPPPLTLHFGGGRKAGGVVVLSLQLLEVLLPAALAKYPVRSRVCCKTVSGSRRSHMLGALGARVQSVRVLLFWAHSDCLLHFRKK